MLQESVTLQRSAHERRVLHAVRPILLHSARVHKIVGHTHHGGGRALICVRVHECECVRVRARDGSSMR